MANLKEDDPEKGVFEIDADNPVEAFGKLLGLVSAQTGSQLGVTTAQASDVLIGLAVVAGLTSVGFDVTAIKEHMHAEVDRHLADLTERLPSLVEDALKAGVSPPDEVLRAAKRQKGVYDA